MLVIDGPKWKVMILFITYIGLIPPFSTCSAGIPDESNEGLLEKSAIKTSAIHAYDGVASQDEDNGIRQQIGSRPELQIEMIELPNGRHKCLYKPVVEKYEVQQVVYEANYYIWFYTNDQCPSAKSFYDSVGRQVNYTVYHKRDEKTVIMGPVHLPKDSTIDLLEFISERGSLSFPMIRFANYYFISNEVLYKIRKIHVKNMRLDVIYPTFFRERVIACDYINVNLKSVESFLFEYYGDPGLPPVWSVSICDVSRLEPHLFPQLRSFTIRFSRALTFTDILSLGQHPQLPEGQETEIVFEGMQDPRLPPIPELPSYISCDPSNRFKLLSIKNSLVLRLRGVYYLKTYNGYPLSKCLDVQNFNNFDKFRIELDFNRMFFDQQFGLGFNEMDNLLNMGIRLTHVNTYSEESGPTDDLLGPACDTDPVCQLFKLNPKKLNLIQALCPAPEGPIQVSNISADLVAVYAKCKGKKELYTIGTSITKRKTYRYTADPDDEKEYEMKNKEDKIREKRERTSFTVAAIVLLGVCLLLVAGWILLSLIRKKYDESRLNRARMKPPPIRGKSVVSGSLSSPRPSSPQLQARAGNQQPAPRRQQSVPSISSLNQ